MRTGCASLLDPRLIEAAHAVDIVALAKRLGARLTSEFQGRVHRVDAGWLAESADGRTLGAHSTELKAVRAVLNSARRS